MGNSHKNLLVWNLWVAQLEPNFDKIAIGWSSSKIVSGSRALPPKWLPQCSCVVIESSFDPGERLQAPGSLWLSRLTLWDRNPPRRGVLYTTLCDKVCQWLATGQWFFSGTPVSSINKTDCHNIAEILLKVEFSTIKPNQALLQIWSY